MEHVKKGLEKTIEKYQEGIKATYTTIIHQAREELGLSLTEYCVADIIHHLSSAPKSRTLGGWCYASKKTLGDYLGLHKRTIERAINKLISLKLLEKDPERKFLTTTELWWEKIEVYRTKILKRDHKNPI